VRKSAGYAFIIAEYRIFARTIAAVKEHSLVLLMWFVSFSLSCLSPLFVALPRGMYLLYTAKVNVPCHMPSSGSVLKKISTLKGSIQAVGFSENLSLCVL
jgi:hypothetical protein